MSKQQILIYNEQPYILLLVTLREIILLMITILYEINTFFKNILNVPAEISRHVHIIFS